MDPRPWAVVIPVKATTRGKSRIAVDPRSRRQLALAMALDTAAAAAATPGVGRVVAVVEDAADGVALASLAGVQVRRTDTRDLNDAIADGIGALAGHPGPVAVLPGDLPGVTADDLLEALTRCAPLPRAVVPDRQGTGTTLLTAGRLEDLRPAYGVGSFARHVAAGAVPIDLPGTSPLRRDIDTVDDLAGAGGPRTLAVLDGIPGLTKIRISECAPGAR